MTEDSYTGAAHRTAAEYLELAAIAELEWQDGRAESARRKAERAERRLAAILNWGPLRLIRASGEDGGSGE